MCGIIGIIDFTGSKPDLENLKKAASFMDSRGPDSEGFWFHRNVALGHKRLSIIDLSDAGKQPMLSSDETVAITFNGEIYNYRELKHELQQAGIKFKSGSDTEVILAGYQFWGIEQLLTRLDGMFVFAIYDLTQREFFLARDRFGKKPLYYLVNNRCFVFGSDIRSVRHGQKNLSIDFESLDFFFQEMVMPQPKTIWKEIKQLEPRRFLKVSPEKGRIESFKYDDFCFKENKYTTEEVLLLTEKKLTEGIIKRTIADVPVACFLSAGVDSGLIVSLLAKNSPGTKVNTFTVGFDGSESDETFYANALAKKYGTNHESILVSSDLSATIPAILDEMGEPMGDSSLVPSYIVCREISQHFKVALSGDGGDELFGYNNYNYAFHLQELLKLPIANRNRKIIQSKILSRIGIGQNLGIYAADLQELNEEKLLRRNMAFSAVMSRELLKENGSGFTDTYLKKCLSEFETINLAEKIRAGSLVSRLQNDYLVKVDRASMMNSLEVRSPFLDTELARFTFTIPNQILFRNGITKYLLKELAVKYIDPHIYKRKKTGFTMPVAAMLRGQLKSFMMDHLTETSITRHKLINASLVSRLVKEHLSCQHDHSNKLWTLICFQFWLNKYA